MQQRKESLPPPICALSFARLFKKLTRHRTPRFIWARLRAAAAKTLWLKPNLSITEISFRVGYAKPSHFTKGVSPGHRSDSQISAPVLVRVSSLLFSRTFFLISASQRHYEQHLLCRRPDVPYSSVSINDG